MAPPRRSSAAKSHQRTNQTSCQHFQENDDSMDVDEIIGPLVRLKTNDGKRFTLTEQEASCSNTLKQMIESSRQTIKNGQTEYIQLPTIRGEIFASVHHWCRSHCGELAKAVTSDGANAACSSSDTLGDESSAADKVFLQSFKEEMLLELMHAANYLDVKSLYDACCRTMARRWEGKKVEEIRKMYNISNDFQPDEENAIIQENNKIGLTE